MDHNGNGDTNSKNNPQMIGKGSGKLGNQRTSGDNPNYSIIKIGQNAEKNPGNLRGLAVTNSSVKNSQRSNNKYIWYTLIFIPIKSSQR